MADEQNARSTRSPQADLLDQVVWDNLSRFWRESLAPDERDALNAVYEGLMLAYDAEYIRLFETQAAKGILTCPLFTQRRWLRLDLNNAKEQSAFLSYLAAATMGQSSVETRTAGDVLDCTVGATNHARHWHISFPWTTTADEDSRVIRLGFTSAASLITAYRMAQGSDGVTRGRRLTPGRDFEMLGDGTAIRLLTAATNEAFEFDVGLDFSAPGYDGYRPVVYRVSTLLAANILQVPPDFTTGHPVHVLVVRNAASPGEDQSSTNNPYFSTRREFIPFTGTIETGAAYGSLGSVVIPVSKGLSTVDTAYVFALVKGEFTTFHSHMSTNRVLSAANAEPTGTSTFVPDVAVTLGLSGSIGGLGQILDLFVDGQLLSPNDYRYDHATNTFTFRVPITFPPTGAATIDLQFADELVLPVDSPQGMHQHRLCVKETVKTPEVPAALDDGGEFDDPLDETGRFDDFVATNVVRLAEPGIDVALMVVYQNGELMHAGTDFNTVEKDNITSLAFAKDIGGTVIQVTYERESLTYLYGDIGSTTFTADSLSAFMDHMTDYLTAFHTQFGASNLTTQQLVLAARIAAEGGNPFLALFYDETEADYTDLPIDAANQPVTAREARNLESSNTTLVALPFLVDHVCNPSVRLQQGRDYDVIRGALHSVRDLTKSRGADDEAPGVWWCPLVVLDERLLAKNFGALLGRTGDSTTAFRNQLITELMLRYSGPGLQALQNAASGGADIFTQAGTIRSIESKTTGYTITLVNTRGDQQAVFTVPPTSALPAVNSAVFPGQPATTPLLAQLQLHNLVQWQGNALVVLEDLVHLKAGDAVRIELFDAGGTEPVLTEMTIDSVKTRLTSTGVESVVAFRETRKRSPRAASNFWAFRPGTPPYAPFRGTVASVAPIVQVAISTEYETLLLNPAEQTTYKLGDLVVPGSPLRPERALVYDAQSRPDWHWITPEHDRHFWASMLGSAVASSEDDRRYISLGVTTDGLVLGHPGVTNPIPVRGSRVTVTETQTGNLLFFTVVGADASGVRLKAHKDLVIATPTSGVALIEPPVTTGDYFEVEPTPVNGSRPRSILAHRHRVGDAAIYLSSAVGFPAAGRVVIDVGAGGAVEVEYDGTSLNRLLNCRWAADNPSLRETSSDPADPGTFDPVLEAGLAVTAVSAYNARILHPAFSALVQKRVVRDHSSFNGKPALTESNADAYYALLAPTTTVVETALNERPGILESALADVAPAASSILLFSRHVVADTLSLRSTDQMQRFHPLQISITCDGAAPVGRQFTVAAGAWRALLAATVVDPDATGALTYEWTIKATRSADVATVLTPSAASTVIEGLDDGNEYAITLTVTTGTGRTESTRLTLVVGQ